jgi:hypothetical protein
MIDEFIPLFSSKKVNICADETFDLGKGKNKVAAEGNGVGRLYVDFLNQVISHVKSYDKQVMFWGDIILHHPELLCDIPKDVILLNWDYNPEVNEENAKIFADSGFTQYLCPGVHGWTVFINHIRNGFRNIIRMASYANKYNAEGILNTNWGDCGHLSPLTASIIGMALGGGLSWNYKQEYNQKLDDFDEFESAISRLEYGDMSETLVKIASQFGEISKINWNMIVFTYCEIKEYLSQSDKYFMLRDLNLKKCILDMDFDKICGAYHQIDKFAEELHLLSASVYSSRKFEIYEIYVAAKGLALSQLLFANLAKYSFDAQTGDMVFTPSELAVKLEGWLAEFMTLWRYRNKESELFRVRDAFREICSILRQYER